MTVLPLKENVNTSGWSLFQFGPGLVPSIHQPSRFHFKVYCSRVSTIGNVIVITSLGLRLENIWYGPAQYVAAALPLSSALTAILSTHRGMRTAIVFAVLLRITALPSYGK